MLTERDYTNPCGSVVKILVGVGAQIGDRAEIGVDAQIGVDVRIGVDAQIGVGARIGNHTQIGNHAYIGDRALIGNHAYIGDRAYIGVGACLGDHALIGNHALIGDYNKTLQPIYIARLGDGVAGWHVTITAETIQIGCKFHSLSEWIAFDDEQIRHMHCYAVEWWRTFKPVIVAMAKARGWL